MNLITLESALRQPRQSSVKPQDDATQPFRVVLHQVGHQWITHLENMEGDGHGGYRSKASPDYYWGHYFNNDFRDALQDYYTRCHRYNLVP